MNRKGQYSIIAALLVAVILIATVIMTYSVIRTSTVQVQPQVLSTIDETNFALKKILGFTVGYYASALQVTGNSTYAKEIAMNYTRSGLESIAKMHPELGASFELETVDLSAYWYSKYSWSTGRLAVKYNLTGFGLSGMEYETSCSLKVNVTSVSETQAQFKVTVDNDDIPLLNLGKQNFKFYRYIDSNSSWITASPSYSTNIQVSSDGIYTIDMTDPALSEIDPYSYIVQVEDNRGLIAVAASFSRYTCALTWNPNATLIDQESFEGSWPPTGWTATGNWNKEDNQKYNGSYSADFDGAGSGASGDLTTSDLNCTDAASVYVDFWYMDDGCSAGEFLLQYYNGTAWITVADLGSTLPINEKQWLHYQERVTDSQYFISNFKIRWAAVGIDNQEHAYVDYVTVKKELNLSTHNATIVIELLQNGTMRWLGQSLQLTTQAKPIPPIPVRSIRVNQTINGVDQEVPFQVEDWASDYMIPLGLANKESIFSGRNMLVFLANPNVTKVTIWWNGSDSATQTSWAYTNRYFNDDTNTRTFSNGLLTIQLSSTGFTITSTTGDLTTTANLLRINGRYDTTDPEWSYAIYNGVVRDVIHGESEYSGGVTGCPNFYTHIVLTLPANATYYTYQQRLIFLDSTGRQRTITDICPVSATTSMTGIFGYNTAGSSYVSVSQNYMYGSLFTSPLSPVIANSISFRGRSDSGTVNVKCLIVRHSDMKIIATTSAISVSSTAQWWTATFTSSPTLSPNTEYVLMIIPSGTVRFYYATGSTNQGHYTLNSYSSPTDPTDSVHNNYRFSIYCSYTYAVTALTENGTADNYPIVSTSEGLFYNMSGVWQHHWTQINFTADKGFGIIFTTEANQMLYRFDQIAGKPTGALSVDASGTFELLPIAEDLNAPVSFTYALDVCWYGAVVNFGTTPIYTTSDKGIPTGLWVVVEYPPVITVSSES